MIAIPLLRFYLFLNSFGLIREVQERWTGLRISDELARDMAKWAAWSRLFRAAQNVPRPDVGDNINEKVDLELMLCMASKEHVERILRVEEIMKDKVTSCHAVIALNQIHLYVPRISKTYGRWDLQSPKLFADLVHGFFQNKTLPDGVISASEYFAGNTGEVKKIK